MSAVKIRVCGLHWLAGLLATYFLHLRSSMSHQFYIALPSDSSMKCYPENTVAKFTTKLPQPISLEGEYEVGLAEIIYPQTWYNIRNIDGEYWIAIIEADFVSDVDKLLKKFVLETFNYSSVNEFITSLNDQMNEAFKDIANIRPEFSYNKATRKIQFISYIADTTEHDITMGLAISIPLQKRLGITRRYSTIYGEALRSAEEEFILNEDQHLMFVYCDVASHTVVGDTTAPLLRVVELNGSRDEMKRLTFPDIHYIPVQKRHFETIEISINTARGRVMPFESGRSVVTLHFRRAFNLFQK